jgi:hypothetical protein
VHDSVNDMTSCDNLQCDLLFRNIIVAVFMSHLPIAVLADSQCVCGIASAFAHCLPCCLCRAQLDSTLAWQKQLL